MLGLFTSLLFVTACAVPFKGREADFTRYVNPFIGCADNGHTFPGPAFPFGMVQVSPDTGNGTWAYCSGYMYLDEKIWGFSQTHLSGTGCPDLGDVQLQPFTGAVSRENYHSAYRKETQRAEPGYYAVTLADFGVDVELTASALGFYPFNPCNDGYVFGAPQLEKVTLRLPNRRTFTVEAQGLSSGNKYVRSVTLNGQPVSGTRLAHADIMKGGRLLFEMGPEPTP